MAYHEARKATSVQTSTVFNFSVQMETQKSEHYGPWANLHPAYWEAKKSQKSAVTVRPAGVN